MKPLLHRAVPVGLLMLCFLSKMAHAQNLHKTVTHGNEQAAIKEDSSNDAAGLKLFAQESHMPQTDKDVGKWKGRVFGFKDMFNRSFPHAAAQGFDDGMHLSTYDYTKWTKDDLTKLATTYNGIDAFVTLMDMKNEAGIKGADGNYTKEAIQAQNALTELKPDCCKSWKTLHNMIIDIEDGNKPQIIALMQRKHLTIPKAWGWGTLETGEKHADIAGDRMRNPAFDQQAALDKLKEHQVVLKETHTVDPTLNAVVLAMKAKKEQDRQVA